MANENQIADAYAASAGPKRGFSFGALYLIRNNETPNGAGLQLGWYETDPLKTSWGMRISGWYGDFREFKGVRPHLEYENWGSDFGGRAQVEWLPGHGRGVRNKRFLLLAMGPGFVQRYRNRIWMEETGWVNTESRLDYKTALVTTIGVGFSSKYGIEAMVGTNVYYSNDGFGNYRDVIEFLKFSDSYVSLGYLF